MVKGYDPNFIDDDITISLPEFDRRLGQSVLRKPGILRNGIYSDHLHFTLVMNEHTQQLIYSAFNLDQVLLKELGGSKGKRGWRKDRDIGRENQLGNEYYQDRKSRSGRKIKNPYDRGHMVMRHNAMWGKTRAEADKGGKATFIYANSSLQHENLNRDEWKALEDGIIRKFSADANDRLSIFTGPIYGTLDRSIHLSDQKSARVPSGFFKVICYKSKNPDQSQKPGVLAFAIFQDEKVLRDRNGSATVKTDRHYQVTISDLQDMTGINFGTQLYDCNPLFYHDVEARNKLFNVPSIPERIPIGRTSDIISSATDLRYDIEALSQRKVVINAAMVDPVGNEATGEWVSLYNRSSENISLKNWKLVDGQGREVILADSVAAGDSLRLKGRRRGKIKLPNSGGSLFLYDEHGCVMDHVTWSRHDLKRVGQGIAYMFERGQ